MADLRRLFHYVLPYWKQLTVGTISAMISSLLVLALPWAISLLVDSVFGAGNTELLRWIAIGLLVIFVVQGVFVYLYAYWLAFVGQRVVVDLRLALHQQLLSLPLRFFDNRRVGELVSRVSNDVTMVQGALTDVPVAILRRSITFVGGIVLMVIMNWQLTLFILAVLPPIVVIGVVLGRRLERLSTLYQDRLADSTTVLEETLSGIRVIKSFGGEGYEQGRYAARIDATFQTGMERIRFRSLFIPTISFLAFAAVVGVLWYGGQQVIAGAITSGELVAFLIYMIMVAGPVGDFAGLYSQLREAIGASRRLFEILDSTPEVPIVEQAPPLPAVTGQVRFVDVSFSYDGLAPVLATINLTAQPGEVIALVGPSGVGKTTLANLIPRFYMPTGGRIEVDGIDIGSVALASLRAQIGLVPQDTFLFGGTVSENIGYGRQGASTEEIVASAQAAYAHDFIQALPLGYDTIVGERGVKLSTGQRQRIAIARALLKNPRILILDEATSALDTESERWVQAALERLMAGRTSFVIAHRLSTVQRADRIVVLQDGEIAEEGRHAELLARGGLYHRLWSLQFAEVEANTVMPLLA